MVFLVEWVYGCGGDGRQDDFVWISETFAAWLRAAGDMRFYSRDRVIDGCGRIFVIAGMPAEKLQPVFCPGAIIHANAGIAVTGEGELALWAFRETERRVRSAFHR